MSSYLTADQLRTKYLEYFKSRGHAQIPPSPLIPENDPTTLFTSSGMQPLVPYLLGQEHPSGTRLVDSQPSIRAQDIEEVGDNRHTTFFEMLGNWSLGDYFKKEQLRWVWEFLIGELQLDPQRIYVSVFSGDSDNQLPKDEESVGIWQELFNEQGIQAKYIELITEEQGAQQGMQGGRIFAYNAKKNWWSRSGVPSNMPSGEPGGPDSEAFYEFTDVEHDAKYGLHCHPNCDCGRFIELGNSVFMQYVKQPDNTFKLLPKQNVDFGGGLERILAATYNSPDVFVTDLFTPIINELEQATGKPYQGQHQIAMRVIADHFRAAVFLASQGVQPSNKQQGYILRRLIRRAVVKMRQLDMANVLELSNKVTIAAFSIYRNSFLTDASLLPKISETITTEVSKFIKTLDRGMAILKNQTSINEIVAFDLFQSYGFPFEITQELAAQKGIQLNKAKYDQEFAKHQQQSRTSSVGMFKGGLADQSENVVKYHTATHLLHASLRQILGTHVQQKGSNITGERLRFDFTHPTKVTDQEISQIETLINQKITADLPVTRTTQSYQEAIDQGALAFFGEKYPDQVSVYTIGDPTNFFSKELCGGPHVEHTSVIGPIKLTKETSASAGVRRIYAELL